MEPLYKTTTKYTLDEYKKFNNAVLKNKKYFLRLAIYEIVFFILALLIENVFLIIFLVLFPLITIIIYNNNVKRVFKSNKLAADKEINFEFYDAYIVIKNENGEQKFEYDKLNFVIETKDNFYLMIATNQGYILTKSNLPDGLENFLKSKEVIKFKKV